MSAHLDSLIDAADRVVDDVAKDRDGDPTLWKFSAAWCKQLLTCTPQSIQKVCGGCCSFSLAWPDCKHLGTNGCVLKWSQRPIVCMMYPLRVNKSGTIIRHWRAPARCKENLGHGLPLVEAMRECMDTIFGKDQIDKAIPLLRKGEDAEVAVPSWVLASLKIEDHLHHTGEGWTPEHDRMRRAGQVPRSKSWPSLDKSDGHIVSRMVRFAAPADVLDNVDRLKTELDKLAGEAKLGPLGAVWHKFDPQGVTGLMLLETSHLAIHTWPEEGVGYLALASCNADVDPDKPIAAFLSRIGGQEATAATGSAIGKATTSEGLYVDPPHGRWIAEGIKKMIMQTRRFDVSGRDLLLASGDKVYGVVQLEDPVEVSVDRFRQLYDQHKINEGERRRIWGDKSQFYGYKIAKFTPYKPPRDYARPGGSHGFLRTVTVKAADEDGRAKAEALVALLDQWRAGTARLLENHGAGAGGGLLAFLRGLPSVAEVAAAELRSLMGKAADPGQPGSAPDVWATTASLVDAAREVLPFAHGRARLVLADVLMWAQQLLGLREKLEATSAPAAGAGGDADKDRAGGASGQQRASSKASGGSAAPALDITPDVLRGWSAEKLKDYRTALEGYWPEATGRDREAVLNAGLLLNAEYSRRGNRDRVGGDLGAALASFTKQVEEEDRITAPVYPSGEQSGPVITLAEVLRHVRPIHLRSPAVYIVGGLANKGATPNDVDVLIRGPLDDSTRKAIEFRIGRMLPPELSKRVHYLEDDMGGPFTDHVEVYDLCLVPRKAFGVKQMAAPVSKADPLLDYPARAGKLQSTLQYHFRGRSLHGDFRVQVGDHLIGWTMAIQKKGLPDVDTVAQAQELGRTFDPAGSRTNKPLRAPSSVYATPKPAMPPEWLRIAPRAFPPGEVGATAEEQGVIVQVDQPLVEYGLQKPHFHEYFLTKSKAGFEGTLLLRRLVGSGGPAQEEEAGRRTPEGEAFWTARLAESLLPSVLRKRAVENGSMPPDGVSAIPASLMRVTPEEFRYWQHKGAEAREVRDALVDEGFFTEKNVVMVNGEYARVESKAVYCMTEDMARAIGYPDPEGQK